jgi:23S rRNA (uracil1939-C5)-methyltransferase
VEIRGHTWQVAVRGAFVDDVVEARVERVFAARELISAATRRIIRAGTMRSHGRCPHGRACGGCPLFSMSVETAHAFKGERIRMALSEAGIDLPVGDGAGPLLGTGSRQKVKLAVGGKRGRLIFGLYRPHTHDLDPAHLCPLTRPALGQALAKLKKHLDAVGVPADGPDGGCKAIIAREGRNGVVVLLVTTRALSPAARAELSGLVERGHFSGIGERLMLREGGHSENSLLGGEVIWQTGRLWLLPLGGGPEEHIDAFCQADPDQAEALYGRVADFLAEKSPGGAFVDAFAGTGGFSRHLLERGVFEIHAVEQNPLACTTLDHLGLIPLRMSMKDALPLLKKRAPLSGMVLDPPRKGLASLGAEVAALGAKRVALVSCDPDALARDLGAFLSAGYAVVELSPYDLFAGTAQVESLALLEKKSDDGLHWI